MTIRLHASTRTDLSGTPFQIYLLDSETEQEVSTLIKQDFKDINDVLLHIHGVARAVEAAATRAGIK